MRGTRQVYVKVVIFLSRVCATLCGHPQNNVIPNFFPDSKCSLKGLSNNVSFIPDYLGQGSES